MVSHADDDGIGLSVAAPIEAVPAGDDPRRGGDWTRTTEFREGRFRANPVGVIAEEDQHRGRRVWNRPPKPPRRVGDVVVVRRARCRSCVATSFTVWVNVVAELDDLQPDVVSWSVPSLAFLRGTLLGAADFTFFYPSDVPRATVQDGKILPILREQWVSLAMEDQFDAVLYLGPPSAMTMSERSPELCDDSTYMEMRRKRLSLVGMEPVLEELERSCLDSSR